KYTADLLHRDKQREEAIEKFQKLTESQAETHRRYVAANEANQVLEEQQGNQREEFDTFKTQVMHMLEAASQAQGFETTVKAVALTPKSKVPTSTPAPGKLAPKRVVINDVSPALSPESQGDVASTSQAPTYPLNNTQTTVPSKAREFFGHNYMARGKARGAAQGHRIVEQTYNEPYYEEDPQGEFPRNRENGPPPAPQQPFPRYGQGRPDPAREYRKIPTVLCPRFGERYNTKDFNTFEREF
ncbi:MAG: hypothetical protein GY821_11005, partial [Gammaproteobacteria bacterium]|nr:hypothetical protein [Gammaproteobacteria bacterium]